MSGEKISVLLVEDDQTHVELIRRALESADHSIELRTARSLREACSVLRDSSPDVLIVDSLLPDGVGLEVLSAAGGKDVRYPVLMMTSSGDETLKQKAMKMGAFRYVQKSVDQIFGMPTLIESTLQEWQSERCVAVKGWANL